MLGRGIYGRPWLAAEMERVLAGTEPDAQPSADARLTLVLEHFRESLAFYGDKLGLNTFRTHLGWYIENAPWPDAPEERRAAKAAICRLATPGEVETALIQLWSGEPAVLAA